MAARESKKPRAKNFTEGETRILVEGVREKRVVLFSKLNNSVTVKSKEAAWQEIATRVNAHHFQGRHWKQMKKKWQDMKAECVRIRAAQKNPPTGGGPPPQSPWYMDFVLDILGEDSCLVNGIGGGLESGDVLPKEDEIEILASAPQDVPDRANVIYAVGTGVEGGSKTYQLVVEHHNESGSINNVIVLEDGEHSFRQVADDSVSTPVASTPLKINEGSNLGREDSRSASQPQPSLPPSTQVSSQPQPSLPPSSQASRSSSSQVSTSKPDFLSQLKSRKRKCVQSESSGKSKRISTDEKMGRLADEDIKRVIMEREKIELELELLKIEKKNKLIDQSNKLIDRSNKLLEQAKSYLEVLRLEKSMGVVPSIVESIDLQICGGENNSDKLASGADVEA